MIDSSEARRGLLDRERFRRPLVYDGSKGVFLSPRLPDVGRSPSDATEWLNLLAPDTVLQMHREYIEAESQIVQTNTFNGNRLRLETLGLGDRVREVNVAGARLAREAAGDEVLVAGVVGPSGKLVAMGEVEPEALTDAFADQAAALAEGGADLFHVETMTDMSEAGATFRSSSRCPSIPGGRRTCGH
jgi:methionine synthase I (cobalamin-dependent)